MIPKKIYLNYVDENDEVKTWSEEPISVYDCKMQNREYTDLSQVWHDTSEELKEDMDILLISKKKGKYIKYLKLTFHYMIGLKITMTLNAGHISTTCCRKKVRNENDQIQRKINII